MNLTIVTRKSKNSQFLLTKKLALNILQIRLTINYANIRSFITDTLRNSTTSEVFVESECDMMIVLGIIVAAATLFLNHF